MQADKTSEKKEDSEKLKQDTIGAAKDIKQEEYALTRAEQEQIISNRRDCLYQAALKAAIGFAVLSAALMTGFKLNERFFDANSRIGILMESVSAQENKQAYPKINVKANFKDEKKSSLIIPLTASIDKENVNIREEFTQNKFVITLSEYSDHIPDGVELVSDSEIMDAVGVYRQNDDVVAEVYCSGQYDYELVMGNNTVTVNFKQIKEQYAATAVVWLPYHDKNRLALPEWRQGIEKFAADNNVKLYMAPDMQEEYTQSEVIAFANEIGADMVLGVEVEQTQEQQSYLTGICNTTYFVPEYNSAQLSVVMTETFAKLTQMNIRGFEEGGSSDALVSEAIVPAAIIKISLTQKDMESVENVYQLNETIATALEGTMGGVLKNYINVEEKEHEG